MSKKRLTPKERLIVGLDVPTLSEAEAIVSELGDTVCVYKIGYQLTFAGGLELARDLQADGKNVFLDMKLLDIDNTVAKAVENVVKMGLSMLTIHAYPKAMRSAVEAASGSDLCLLGVTVLTSMDGVDLYDAGYGFTPEELVRKRALDARAAGMGGIVASAQEAASIRQLVGLDMAVVTPGIRLAGGEAGDQKRVMTPKKAIASGASHLVVARPIVQAEDKVAAATQFVQEIKQATN